MGPGEFLEIASGAANDSQHFAFGYLPSDCSGNGAVDATDMSIIDNNAQLLLFYARP